MTAIGLLLLQGHSVEHLRCKLLIIQKDLHNKGAEN
jgi:hypothetical protein